VTPRYPKQQPAAPLLQQVAARGAIFLAKASSPTVKPADSSVVLTVVKKVQK